MIGREPGSQHELYMLIGTTGSHMSLLLEVRERAPFGRWVLVSQLTGERWLLSDGFKPSYSPGWAHFWILDTLTPNILAFC